VHDLTTSNGFVTVSINLCKLIKALLIVSSGAMRSVLFLALRISVIHTG